MTDVGEEAGIQDFIWCAEHNCFYIANCLSKYVQKINSIGSVCQAWYIIKCASDEPRGLSATKDCEPSGVNLLVACSCDVLTGKVMEVNSQDELVRILELKPWLRFLWHAVPLSNRKYVVCTG